MKFLRNILRRLSDRLPRHIAKRVDAFPESGMGYTVVAVKTKDGRIFRQIVMTSDMMGYFGVRFEDFDNPDTELPFRLRDVIDVEWEGYRVGNTIKKPESFKDEWKLSRS